MIHGNKRSLKGRRYVVGKSRVPEGHDLHAGIRLESRVDIAMFLFEFFSGNSATPACKSLLPDYVCLVRGFCSREHPLYNMVSLMELVK